MKVDSSGTGTGGNVAVETPGTIDLAYFITVPGAVKLIQFGLGIVLLCIGTPFWLSIATYIGFILTALWIGVYLLALQKKYLIPFRWMIMEFYYTVGATVVFGVTSLLTLIFLYFMAALFGILITAAYGIGAIFIWKDFKPYYDADAMERGES